MNHNKKAFTMLELIFAIVIIGVLSALALPNFFDMKFKADFTKFESEVRAVQQKIQNKKTENIFMSKLKTYSTLGVNETTKKAFTNLFEDGFEYGNSKGWMDYSIKKQDRIISAKIPQYRDYVKAKRQLRWRTEFIKYKLSDGIEFYYAYNNKIGSFDCAYFECKGCSVKRQKLLEKLSNECLVKKIL